MNLALICCLALMPGVQPVSSSVFGPNYSMKDPLYFSRPPHVVAKPEGYVLRWRYGKFGFYFRPDARVNDGELQFSLSATSSSGNLRNKIGEMKISDPQQVRALEQGGAFWMEPSGEKIRLDRTK